ncbi:MAG: DNA double-strand break repair nuclease NurA [Leptolyngbya sp. SIO4C1]|nr:DNA double-strand break repair nuclease NurA [Leptolyngbya sp. SIO4C1]
MLDLTKLAAQMQGISEHLAKESEAAQRRVEIAKTLLHQAQPRQTQLVEQLYDYRSQMGFTAAEPIEPLDTRRPLSVAPEAHTVLATDGSQINPSHHEIAYCYLLNVGRVILHYGQSRYPLLDSLPEVIYRPEDLYASRQWGIRTEEWMGYRRTVAEAVMLGEMGEGETRRRGDAEKERRGAENILQSPKFKIQNSTLAMTDGSLIYWFLDPLPAAARDQILQPILAAWEQLRQVRVPLVGYLSASRSGEALNFLRLQSCIYDQPDCLSHCEGQTDGAPCQVFSPLRDVTLWNTLLQPGERGPLFKSSADILQLYGEHSVYFCYVHVGSEIARVELPQWVVEDPVLLDSALSLTLMQVQKGYGYPVALAEAHNQAVVRGGDRSRFFALLEQQMIKAGLQKVGISFKEARKRGSIA